MDDDTDTGSEMVRELGINPGFDVDDRQRFELLREWHTQDAEHDEENEEKQ
jgi:hypothetical protein